MSTQVLIRQAVPGDADGMVAVIREGFEPELREAIVYGCSGIGQFIRDQLNLPHEVCDRVYTVAEQGGRIVGCVELRRLPGLLILNYIAVRAQLRASGVARDLLRDAIVHAEGARYGTMALDVFTTNTVAREWYLRLGFAAQERTEWWSVDLAAGPKDGPDRSAVIVNGFPHAEASQVRFGFSQLDVTTSSGSYTVGRMGVRWFRITQAAALLDGALLTTIRLLEPERDLLVLLPEAQLPGTVLPIAARVAVSERMFVAIPALLDRLHPVI